MDSRTGWSSIRRSSASARPADLDRRRHTSSRPVPANPAKERSHHPKMARA